MRKRVFGAILTAAVGCGGGGGGGSSSGDLRVIHAALDAAPIQACLPSCEDPQVPAVRFAQRSRHAGDLSDAKSVLLLSGEGAKYSVPLTVQAGAARKSIVVSENQNGALISTILTDGVAPPPSGRSALRVIHAVRPAAPLAISIGAIETSAGPVAAETPSYLDLPAGTHTLSVLDSVTRVSLYDGRVDLPAGGCSSLLLAGETGYFVTALLLDDCSK